LNASADRFVLAAEVPCSPDDPICRMSEADMTVRCLKDLRRLDIVLPATEIISSFTRTLPGVYPIYDHHWKAAFELAYQRLDCTENLYMIGRSALFLHCNIDHCMLMALELARHLAGCPRDKLAWSRQLARFTAYRIRE
jgi:UDP-galactopyranose mutase